MYNNSENYNSENRRDFLKKAGTIFGIGVGSLVFSSALSSCSSDDSPSDNNNDDNNPYEIDLADFPTLATVGSGVKVMFSDQNGGKAIIVVRQSETSFGAFTSVCTHNGCEVMTPSRTAKDLVCPCHGSSFSAADGTVTNGPANMPLKSWPVEYDAEKNKIEIKFS